MNGRRLAVLCNLGAKRNRAKPYFGPVSGGTVGHRAVDKAAVGQGVLGRGAREILARSPPIAPVGPFAIARTARQHGEGDEGN
jgi:hypothetical protein